MKLYILRPIDSENGPWNPWYDKSFGFIVAAPNELRARRVAASHCGDEGTRAWIDSTLSTCEILVAPDGQGVVMQDFYSA